MAVCESSSDIESRCSLESQPLLRRFSKSSSIIHSLQRKIASISRFLKHFCITSKAAVLVLLWTMLVGAVYYTVVSMILVFLMNATSLLLVDASLPFVILYFFIAVVFISFPVSGFLADVYFGRFKTIAASLCLILLSLTIFLLSFAVSFYVRVPNNIKNFFFIVGGFVLLAIVIGIAGYSANVIQFGLDQLVDVPSRYQALFVHWAKWSYELLSTVVVGLFAYYSCGINDVIPGLMVFVLPIVICVCSLFIMLLFSCWKRHWFYTEPGQHNPYKMVIKVLNFARKHKYPLQRSAFTYCDDERPSRLDFAKERYGGPFTTEQVEDVKTFLRIITFLFAVGPVFVMDLPSSNVALLKYGTHIGSYQLKQYCHWEWIVVNSGLIKCIVSATFLPIYIISIWRHIPKIFTRLGCGIILYFLGTMGMLAIDVAGHVHSKANTTQCIFSVHRINGSLTTAHLGMHWSVLVLPNILLGVGPSLVTVTIFEFISAQSPHSMKGLLLGVFFAITGVFQFLSSLALTPFSSQKIWARDEHSPVISCLSGYLFFTCVVALIGFALFSVVAKWYKYRERDDKPYDQRFVIDVYNRYLTQAHDYEQSYSTNIN